MLNIHIIKSPEYSIEEFRTVTQFLSAFEGPLKFVPSLYEFDSEEFYFLQYNLYPYHNFKYPDDETIIKFNPKRDFPLSWRELFWLCSHYREVFNIDDSGFVILLTQRKNSLNWFSSFDANRNIFVQTSDWEKFTHVHSKYAISYQIIENVMSSLMKLDLINIPNLYVHEPVIGCMNDFCQNKNQIAIKLQTANICQTCRNKLQIENVETSIINQSIRIFEAIRSEVVYINQPIQPADPQPLVVDQENKIMLPIQNIEIRLNPLFKTLYLFFLMHPSGVPLVQLSDYHEDLMNLYIRIRPNAAIEDAKTRIEALSHPSGERFNPAKSHINKIITELIQPPLANYYQISGSANNPFYIDLPRNLVDIRF